MDVLLFLEVLSIWPATPQKMPWGIDINSYHICYLKYSATIFNDTILLTLCRLSGCYGKYVLYTHIKPECRHDACSERVSMRGSVILGEAGDTVIPSCCYNGEMYSPRLWYQHEFVHDWG